MNEGRNAVDLLERMVDAVAREAVSQGVGIEGLMIVQRCLTESRPRPVAVVSGYTMPPMPVGADQALSEFAELVCDRMASLGAGLSEEEPECQD